MASLAQFVQEIEYAFYLVQRTDRKALDVDIFGKQTSENYIYHVGSKFLSIRIAKNIQSYILFSRFVVPYKISLL